MALFGKKKGDGTTGDAGEGTRSEAASFNPDNAKRFYEHARTVHETGSYEYAMTLWLQGMRHDPSELSPLEQFWRSATAFVNSGGGKASKETRSAFSDRKAVINKYLGALLDWGIDQFDASSAVAAAEYGSKLHADTDADMSESVYWIAERALALVGREKKPKTLYLKLMDACGTVGAYDLAVRAGDAAAKADPTDTDLINRVRNFAAQATMSTGGYGAGGSEQGGFQRSVRDAEKQRLLAAQDSVVKTEDVKDQLIANAEEQVRIRPGDLPSVNQLVKALLDRGRPEDEKRAVKLLEQTFEQTKQFQFRQKMGEVKLRWARRKLQEYLDAAADNPGDEQAQSNAAKAKRKYLEMELAEYRLRVDHYPTDIKLKFELGKREFELGNHEEAIQLFQEAQHDPRNRAASLGMLGQSFAAMGWHDEAIDTLRRATEELDDPKGDMGLSLRYGLMDALARKAGVDRDLELASEAEKIASGIAIQNIGYRDIRQRRDEIKALVAELKAG